MRGWPVKLRLSSESGQVLLFAVLAMTIVFAMGAIIVDVGLAISEKDRVQTAADAASLAGGLKLSGGAGVAAAQNAAFDAYKANGFPDAVKRTDCTDPSGDDVCINIPPLKASNSAYRTANYVEVLGSKASGSNFLSIFGVEGVFNSSAKSISGYTSGGPGYGIFAYTTNPDTTCSPAQSNQPGDDVDISGSNVNPIVLDGDFRTNGSVYVGGVPPALVFTGTATYGCQIGPLNNIPAGATQQTAREAWPAVLDLSLQSGLWVSTDIQTKCASNDPGVYRIVNGTISQQNPARDQNGIARFHFANSSQYNSVFDPGIYCFTGTINLPTRYEGCGDIPPAIGPTCNNPGGVTFAALGASGRIVGGGSCGSVECTNVTAYFQNILFYTEGTGTGALQPGGCLCNGRRVTYTGILAAPNGRLNPNGAYINFNGGWAADRILITGGPITIKANGALGGGGVSTNLVE